MTSSDRHLRCSCSLFVICFCLVLSETVWAQAAAPKKVPTPSPQAETTAAAAEPEPPKDVLGRGTPRGAVVGFINASRKGNGEVAALYLNTALRGTDSHVLANQLAAVLNQKLPARLNQISDKPEGAVPDPLKPNEDVVGTIETDEGELNIVVERVDRGKLGKVWLFSGKTLDSIPKVYQELNTPAEEFLPEFMVSTRIFGVALFQWLTIFLGIPFLYLATGLLGRILSWSVGKLRRRLTHNPNLKNPSLMRAPIRLLLVALGIYLGTKSVRLPLLARQFWLTFALLIVVTACLWFLLLLNRSIERYLVERRPSLSGSASVIRLFRRTIDGLLIFGALLFVLYHFGIQLTAALAGLGVGGIAVALAAQKTLENVIGGVSLIADKALSVGDFINLGDVQGTVEDVGLRSTRIRTLDRTVVSLPNGQIAGMRLETISVRDKFWFHPIFGLRYETTLAQLRSVLSGIRTFLGQHPNLEPASVRVRFIRVGTYSFDVEVFAYAFAHDWSNFLEIQEELLFAIIDIIQKAGTALAFPSQHLYLADYTSKKVLRWPGRADKESNAETLGDREFVSGTL